MITPSGRRASQRNGLPDTSSFATVRLQRTGPEGANVTVLETLRWVGRRGSCFLKLGRTIQVADANLRTASLRHFNTPGPSPVVPATGASRC